MQRKFHSDIQNKIDVNNGTPPPPERYYMKENSIYLFFLFTFLIVTFLIVIIIELTHSKTVLEITVEIEPQPAASDFKNLSQYSSRSK